MLAFGVRKLELKNGMGPVFANRREDDGHLRILIRRFEPQRPLIHTSLDLAGEFTQPPASVARSFQPFEGRRDFKHNGL
jgi:hypothetical protein